jgi:hypothetical protein
LIEDEIITSQFSHDPKHHSFHNIFIILIHSGQDDQVVVQHHVSTIKLKGGGGMKKNPELANGEELE